MRMLLRVTFPVEAGNKAIQNGALPETMQNMLATLEPEAAYFFPQDGKRGGFIVFDLKDPSDIPSIAEPLFQRLHATVEFTPVMNANDLRAGLSRLKQT
ncbi:MAG TPA: DUF3303 family protein [bacterium]|nr:DUF3303 family protein [bacterium]